MYGSREKSKFGTSLKDYEVLREARAKLLRKYAPGTTERQVQWPGGETQVLELGDGPPLLMVHGGLGQASDWAPIMAQLSREFHVYAIDRPGHGMANLFDYHGVKILPHAVEFLKATLDGIGVKCAVIVGNSMGGRWAIELTLREPDRVTHLVLPGVPAGAGGRNAGPLYDGQTIFEGACSEGIGEHGLLRRTYFRGDARRRHIQLHPESGFDA
jgi:pimeloyl-ACP methyl ester carboxylesterase